MELAIQKEVRPAREEGHVDEGKTWISVTVYGGWGKLSYGHGYNSNSGLACIIGAKTQKLPYIETKNKFRMYATGTLLEHPQDASVDILARNILCEKIPRLTSATLGAIRQNEGGEVEQLRTDLRNGPNHVFGSRSACRETYCTRKNTEETNFIQIWKRVVFRIRLSSR
ncbi:hypothetical protein PR048_008239 [Dryococelus australis]|uniref:Mutator-like transposase domain-containing protein n=1 Tax=Dryococelus australis TaxID=614101 RepID=A0ABQ9HWJ1_9NEOP|nr:hypothetical protein PR048_008239 [Dryococelus australis]